MMLVHSFVPDAFGWGVVIPIIKDKNGDPTVMDNYRPITLSVAISKIFESALLEKFSNSLCSDVLQFGFKKNVSCTSAIFALRQVTDYFTNRYSNVYIASLDASKAFDRVNHFKLFTTLIQKGLPKCFVYVLYEWYTKLFVVVRWNDWDSAPLKICSGVRQGEILSPVLFNLYANEFITSVRKLNLGCQVGENFMGCLMYADDLLLLSASVLDLQKMLDTCGLVGDELRMSFNCAKSACLVLGPNSSIKPGPMSINGLEIKWVDKMKYLGISLVSGKKFMVDLQETRRKFFISINTILNKCKYASDIAKLNLIESHCLPVLLYGVDALHLTSAQLKELGSWWNAGYRKIFGYNKWESVKELIYQLGRLDIQHLVAMRRVIFVKRLSVYQNSFFKSVMSYYLQGPECVQIFSVNRLELVVF